MKNYIALALFVSMCLFVMQGAEASYSSGGTDYTSYYNDLTGSTTYSGDVSGTSYYNDLTGSTSYQFNSFGSY